MSLNIHSNGVDITFSDARLLRNARNAQKKLNMQVAADCTPLVPKGESGMLRGSVDYPDGIYGKVISWGGSARGVPYAHYQYIGELYLAKNGSSWARKGEKKYPAGRPLSYSQPGTGSHWFDEAKKTRLHVWEKVVADEMRKP